PVIQQQRVHGRGLTPPKLTLTGGDKDEVASLDSPSTAEWQEDDIAIQHGSGHCSRTDEEEAEEIDEEENVEALTCNVCDRFFPTSQYLQQHQLKKRHYGCSTCENVFNSLMALEYHKEVKSHWSDEEYIFDTDDDDDADDDSLFADEVDEEEKEKLL
ncbi:unnamed protein product, partial [Meganyctiphanes norvegica]